jgi:hypothetical protein
MWRESGSGSGVRAKKIWKEGTATGCAIHKCTSTAISSGNVPEGAA